jgi:Asp-tRNA(Asn)/Glu-tRNA(Gln) amidotransferase A subunit family amidase
MQKGEHTATTVAPEESAGELTRRSFLARSGTVAAAAGVATAAGPAGALTASAPAAAPARRSSGSGALPSVSEVLAAQRDLVDHEVIELAALLKARKVSSVELTEAYLERIEALNGPFEVYGDNGGYNAFVRIDADAALAAAAAADKRLKQASGNGEPAPLLCGIPMGFKDSIATQGFQMLNGSVAYDGNVASGDSTPVALLRAKGVVPVGITIASAFSGSIAGTFSGNAWNLDYVPGGSSQGSGVAPIARLVAATLGEETGGSIIFPAACNGASAIKPSQGLVSTAGVMPLAPGLDTIGPICRSGRDAALIMNSLIAPDAVGDPQTLAVPRGFPKLATAPRKGTRPLSGTTIGVNKADWIIFPGSQGGTQRGVDPQSLYGEAHLEAFNRLLGELEAMGANVVEFEGVDYLEPGEETNPYFLSPDVLMVIDGANISPQSAVVNSNRNDIAYTAAVRDFAATRPPEQAELLLNQYGRQGSFEAAIVLQAEVTAAVRAEGERRRRKFASNYKGSFDEAGVDLMVVLTLGDKPALRANQQYPARRNNQIANNLSFPMVSFPIGYDPEGLPISAQLKGPRFSEPQMVQAMIDYQARYPAHHRQRPPDPEPRLRRERLAPAETRRLEFEDLSLSEDPLVYEENHR